MGNVAPPLRDAVRQRQFRRSFFTVARGWWPGVLATPKQSDVDPRVSRLRSPVSTADRHSLFRLDLNAQEEYHRQYPGTNLGLRLPLPVRTALPQIPGNRGLRPGRILHHDARGAVLRGHGLHGDVKP
ncbi:hypothetical protein D3C86_1578010 [compost metagenome]